MNPKKPRGRPKGKPGVKSATRSARRQKLAAAVIAGTPIVQAARDLDVSRSWASREANAPETKALIDQIVDRNAAKIEQLVGMALDAIRDHIGPLMTFRLPGDKEPVILPNEPRVRLLAAKRVIELALAGRKGQEAAGGDTTITWQQFLTIYQQKRGGQN